MFFTLVGDSMFKNYGLFPPYLPQMNDGIINEDDLSVDNKIYVEIAEYQLADVADEIRVNFDKISSKLKVITDPKNEFPVQMVFDANIIPDGVYKIDYSVTDFAGNISESPFTFAIVDRRDSGTLPAPIFIDADINNIINNNDVVSNFGTHILVPIYPNISIGDEVVLSFWIIDDETNLVAPGSSYTIKHLIVGQDITDGFVTLVPEINILLVKRGKAKARYQSIDANQHVETSKIATAMLELDISVSLPAPVFVDNIHGWLTSAQLSKGIRVRCIYDDMAIGDIVTLYIRGYTMDNIPINGTSANIVHTVTLFDVDDGYLLLTFLKGIAEKLNFGYFTSYYKVFRANKTRYSYFSNVKVDLEHMNPLSAPVFMQAENGVIYISDIEMDNGAIVRVSYPEMALNDTLSIYIYGTDENGHFINNSGYQNVVILNTGDVANQYYDFIDPKKKALLVPRNGKLHAYFTVIYADDGGFSYSEQSNVVVDSKISDVITSNAAPYDYNVVHVRSYNYARIIGEPGTILKLSSPIYTQFVESGTNTHQVTVNPDGEGRFRLLSSHSGDVTISIVQATNPIINRSLMTHFGNYILTDGNIDFYNNSTNALSDGVMPCCIYLRTAPKDNISNVDITKVFVQVDGNAKIVGSTAIGGQSTTINLNDDFSCEIQIVNTVSESISAIITLPESPGTLLILNLFFQ